MAFQLIQPVDLPPYYRADDLTTPHGFFTADGGVSTGLYQSLNCGFGSQDDPALVGQNRARACQSLGLDPARLVGAFQIHGNICLTLPGPTSAMQARNTGTITTDELERADAVVTTTPGVTLSILTADCLPVLFADLDAGVIGACHAGWRGAVDGVTDSTLAAMRAEGATQITALLGPTIRQPSYQVGADMRDAVIRQSESSLLSPDQAATCFTPDPQSPPDAQKYYFDLAAYVRLRLTRAGIDRILDCGLDTYPERRPDDESPRFFSHRRATHHCEPDSGRLISLISL